MAKYNAQSLGECLWKVALYVRHGYVRYMVCTIPDGKDLAQVEAHIIRDYQITYDRDRRAVQRRQGNANVVMVRFHQQVILMASHGAHDEFEKRDHLLITHKPLHLSGYSIGIKHSTAWVQIAPRRMDAIHRHASAIALHTHQKVTHYLRGMSPFTFKGVQHQRWKLYLHINKKRNKAGLSRIRWETVKREGE